MHTLKEAIFLKFIANINKWKEGGTAHSSNVESLTTIILVGQLLPTESEFLLLVQSKLSCDIVDASNLNEKTLLQEKNFKCFNAVYKKADNSQNIFLTLSWPYSKLNHCKTSFPTNLKVGRKSSKVALVTLLHHVHPIARVI